MNGGMNAPKPCARCDGKVYPLEQLKCLDKIWHKGCFKCTECQMPLSMKNYKGYNKFPYCDAHVPKPSFTTITDTPENRRLAENTANQSGILYHADFEKSRGKFTSVTDDPETLRLMQNAQTVSNIGYHNLHDHKQEMETLRNREGMDPSQQQHSFVSNIGAGQQGGQPEEEARSSIEYQHSATPKMWQNGFPPMQPPGTSGVINKKSSASSSSSSVHAPPPRHPHPNPSIIQLPPSHAHSNNLQNNRNAAQQAKPKVGSLADYDPLHEDRRSAPTSNQQQPPPQQQFAPQPVSHQPVQRPAAPQMAPQSQQSPQPWQQQQPQQQQRPVSGYGQAQQNQNQPPSYSQYQQQQQQNQQQPPAAQFQQAPQSYGGYGQPQQQQQPARPTFQTQSSAPKPYSPQPQQSSLYGQQPAFSSQQHQPQPQQQSYNQQDQQRPAYNQIPQQQPQSQFGRQQTQNSANANGSSAWPPKQQSMDAAKVTPPWTQPASAAYINQQTTTQTTYSTQQSQQRAPPQPTKTAAKTFKAMYDYNAGDVDEVSFRDGDVIVNVQPIDAGWMIGTVQRTGKSGMLPSNYVTPVN